VTLPAINWLALLPGMLLVIVGLSVLALDLFSRQDEESLGWITLLGLGASAAAIAGLWGQQGNGFGGTLLLDRLSVVLALLIVATGVLVVLMSMNYLETIETSGGEFYALVVFSLAGMVFMAASSDLILLFIALEVMSLAVYVLAGIARGSVHATEAAMKYFLLGAFATGFLLYGIALLYGATGSTRLDVIGEELRRAGRDPLLLCGVCLLLVGLGFKVAAVPFHMWTPDVYEGAPTSVTALMAVGVKAAAFAAVVRVFLQNLAVFGESWWWVLWVLSALTMTVGNVLAISQKNIKRMLAYSSIAHAGYLLVGVAAGGPEAPSAIVFYLLAYAFMNLGAFGVVIAVGSKGEPNESIDDYAGLGFRYPLIGAAMVAFMLSLTGMPPFAGFAAKFYLFSVAIERGFVALAVLGVLNSLVSAAYYIRVLVVMFMREPEREVRILAGRPYLMTSIVAAAVLTLLIGVFPPFGGFKL